MQARPSTALIGYLCLLVLLVGCRSTPTVTVPEPVESGLAPVNGIELFYKKVGSGQPIVVLHGGPGDSHSYFLPQMAALADRYQLIFYDQRASGQSTGSQDLGSVTAATFVADLEGLRQAQGLEKMTLLGHSWGGLLALLYALEYPDQVEALILVAPAPASALNLAELNKRLYGRMSPLERREVAEALALATEEPTPETMADFKQLLYSFYFYDRKVLADLSPIETSPANARVAFQVNQAIWDSLGDYDLHQALTTLEIPTLIIHCNIDPVPIEGAQHIHEALPDSEFVQLKRCGHFPFIDNPRPFFEQLSAFLSRPTP
jgi:proline iminopeptidase